jgi:hypothetical protein
LDDNPRPHAAAIQALNEGASRMVVCEVFLTDSNHTAEGKNQIEELLEQFPNLPVALYRPAARLADPAGSFRAARQPEQQCG